MARLTLSLSHGRTKNTIIIFLMILILSRVAVLVPQKLTLSFYDTKKAIKTFPFCHNISSSQRRVRNLREMQKWGERRTREWIEKSLKKRAITTGWLTSSRRRVVKTNFVWSDMFLASVVCRPQSSVNCGGPDASTNRQLWSWVVNILAASRSLWVLKSACGIRCFTSVLVVNIFDRG